MTRGLLIPFFVSLPKESNLKSAWKLFILDDSWKLREISNYPWWNWKNCLFLQHWGFIWLGDSSLFWKNQRQHCRQKLGKPSQVHASSFLSQQQQLPQPQLPRPGHLPVLREQEVKIISIWHRALPTNSRKELTITNFNGQRWAYLS